MGSYYSCCHEVLQNSFQNSIYICKTRVHLSVKGTLTPYLDWRLFYSLELPAWVVRDYQVVSTSQILCYFSCLSLSLYSCPQDQFYLYTHYHAFFLSILLVKVNRAIISWLYSFLMWM